MHSDTFEQINKFVKGHGEKGLILLIIFKYLKGKIIEHLENEYSDIDWNEFEDEINQECLNISKEIIEKNKDNPTEKEIKDVIDYIKSKIENTMS